MFRYVLKRDEVDYTKHNVNKKESIFPQRSNCCTH